jgi:hypothetical protein
MLENRELMEKLDKPDKARTAIGYKKGKIIRKLN